MHLAIVLAAMLCEAQGDTTRRPPAVLSTASAAGYPSGAFIRLEVAVNASGRFLRANYDIGPSALRQTALAWAKRVTYVPPREHCKNVAGDVTVDAQFYPPSSGVAGVPPVVQAIDFGELAYARGPCPDSARAVLHQNAYSYFSKQAGTDMTVSVENVFSGVARRCAHRRRRHSLRCAGCFHRRCTCVSLRRKACGFLSEARKFGRACLGRTISRSWMDSRQLFERYDVRGQLERMREQVRVANHNVRRTRREAGHRVPCAAPTGLGCRRVRRYLSAAVAFPTALVIRSIAAC